MLGSLCNSRRIPQPMSPSNLTHKQHRLGDLGQLQQRSPKCHVLDRCRHSRSLLLSAAVRRERLLMGRLLAPILGIVWLLCRGKQRTAGWWTPTRSVSPCCHPGVYSSAAASCSFTSSSDVRTSSISRRILTSSLTLPIPRMKLVSTDPPRLGGGSMSLSGMSWTS